MKKLLFLLFTIHCSLLTLFSQAPQSFNYQAVAWDDAGDLMKSTSLTVRISIFSESETGTLQWEETHSTATNEYGLFKIQIGDGTRTAGSATEFSDINWGSFLHFLKVEVNAGSGYNNMGTTQFLSVPYALSVSSLKSLNIEEPTGHNPEDALFEV
ncbi:MAG: hypothetical protein KAX05_16165, partial [Bacteroidales bacterium]|nr:hypothetical protein [Bacteroidales bacterium]